eukprot:COSAG02_NODE_322_length_24779_cov_14.118233_8_plen_185_part_00
MCATLVCWSAGLLDVRTRIAMIMMTQCCVSQVNQPKLLASILKLWGHELVGPLPTRRFAHTMLGEGGVLANSIIGQQILDWGLTGAQDVTACIDAVSIGEWKGEAAALVKPTLVPHPQTGELERKFVRIATPLIELPNGSDECWFGGSRCSAAFMACTKSPASLVSSTRRPGACASAGQRRSRP